MDIVLSSRMKIVAGLAIAFLMSGIALVHAGNIKVSRSVDCVKEVPVGSTRGLANHCNFTVQMLIVYSNGECSIFGRGPHQQYGDAFVYSGTVRWTAVRRTKATYDMLAKAGRRLGCVAL